MNYRNWIKTNKWELAIALYLILLFVSHQTFTPNLYFFRELTAKPIFRLCLLGLAIYSYYAKFPRNLIILLAIVFLLTEYHAWGNYSWEFFDTNTAVTFIKKAGSNLYLTYPSPTAAGQPVSLSEPHGDFGGQMWTLNVATDGVTMSPVKATLDLSGELKMVEDKDSANKWTITEVEKVLVEDKMQTIDTENAKTITGVKDLPCKNNMMQYAKIKLGDKYLTADTSGHLSLSTDDSDNIWYIFKCMPDDKPVTDLVEPATKDIDTTKEEPASVKLETTDEQPKGCLENYENALGLQGNKLDEILNQLRTDTPIGKAYRTCSDGLCYYDKSPVV